MTFEQLARLRALADAATPGPWVVTTEQKCEYDHECNEESETSVFAVDEPRRFRRSVASTYTPFLKDHAGEDCDNAEFIAAARTAIPELLDFIATLQSGQQTP